MKGFRINKNKEHVKAIIEGLLRKNGYCPCKVQQIPENLCPCDEFVESKICHCDLWVKDDESCGE